MNTIQSGTFSQVYPQTAVPADAAGTAAAPAPAASAPKPAAAPAATAPTHTVSAQANAASGAASATPQHMMGYLSPAYFMAAMQMMPTQSMFPGMMPFSGVPAQGTMTSAGGSAAEAGGHVTANTTNSLAPTQSAGSMQSSGMAPLQGMGAMSNMAGAMAMPIGFVFAQPMMLSPVLFGVFFGFAAMPGMNAQPVAQQPAQPAAPLPADSEVAAEEPPAVETPAAQTPAEESPAEESAPVKAPVVEVSAEEFRKLRARSSKLETSLQLSLTTKDGDTVTLDFSQIDLMERSRSQGQADDGKGMRHRGIVESHDRVVNMSVEGDLDEGERSAIDAVLAEVIDLANRFFTGNMDGVMERLQSFDLDTEALAEFSLQMNMTKSVNFSRAHHHGRDAEIQKLASRDGEVMKMLEFFATEQRTLIKSASEVLDAPSAVKLVKGLLPPLLDDSFVRLTQALDDAAKPVDDAAAEADVVAEQSPVEESLEA